MPDLHQRPFRQLNTAYNQVFRPDQLSLGLVVPIEHYAASALPTLQDHVQRAQLAEALGFSALWLRDIPLHVPAFGDAGQTYEPFTYLGYLAAQTQTIGLGVASIALPLRHAAHVAKAAATVDQLSQGRLLLGIASGDRMEEYPALGQDYTLRGERFREAYAYLRKAQEPFPRADFGQYGHLSGQADLLPKPVAGRLPLLLTGYSQQSADWLAQHGDGWMSYPRELNTQEMTIARWRAQSAQYHDHDKPFMQPLYVVLQEQDDAKPQPIPLGFRLGANYLSEYLHRLQEIGVNHVAINLRFNEQPIEKTLEQLASKVLSHFTPVTTTP